MKGHVKLELFDKNGSLVEKREDHNMMTNALKEALLPVAGTRQMFWGVGNGVTSSRNADYYLQILFSVLQLFSDELSGDANDFTPSGQDVVGLARFDNAYTGTNPLYGDYNGIESGWSDDGKTFKFVYDFSNTQANGTIASLGLSPIYAQGSGFGVDNLDSKTMNTSHMLKHCMSKQDTYNSPSQPFNGDGIIYFDYEKNYFVSLSEGSCISNNGEYLGSTKKVTLTFRRFPMSGFLLGKDIDVGLKDSSRLLPVFETKQFSIHNTLNASSANYGFICYANGKIYAMYKNTDTWVANESVTITVIDTETWAESTISVTNTTGKTIKLYNCLNTYKLDASYSQSLLPVTAFCDGDYLLVYTSDYYYCIIDLNDNTNVYYAKNGNGDAITSTSVRHAIYYDNGVVYLVSPTTYYLNSPGQLTSIHLKTGKYKVLSPPSDALVSQKCFAYCDGIRTGGFPVKNHPSLIAGITSIINEKTSQNRFFFTGWMASICLMTKMNLEEPVVKTSDLSMKVTYSLTFNND